MVHVRRLALAALLVGAGAACTAAAADAVPPPPAARDATPPPASSFPEDRFPEFAAASYLLVVDGVVRGSRAPAAPRAPASLAKLMTALVALEPGWDPTAWVVVERAAVEAGAGGARLGLRAGDQVRAGDLLRAMLVRSANDAATALARHRGGDVGRFVARMNTRAAALGLTATRFVNPTGFDDPAQTTTAEDLLRLAQSALAEPEIATAVVAPEGALTTRAGRILRFRSSNPMLGKVDGVVGVKTGHTGRAGKCAILCARRGGRETWLVLLDAPERWLAAGVMIEEAFRARGGS